MIWSLLILCDKHVISKYLHIASCWKRLWINTHTSYVTFWQKTATFKKISKKNITSVTFYAKTCYIFARKCCFSDNFFSKKTRKMTNWQKKCCFLYKRCYLLTISVICWDYGSYGSYMQCRSWHFMGLRQTEKKALWRVDFEL